MSCDVGWRMSFAMTKTMSFAHSPTFPSLHLRHNSFSNLLSLYLCHSSFSNPSVASPMSQFILQPSFCFSYITSSAHSPTFPSLHLCHNSFSNPSIALPMSQLILQPLCCFTYVTVHSPTLLLLLLRHKFFTQFTWRAAHEEGGNHKYRQVLRMVILTNF